MTKTKKTFHPLKPPVHKPPEPVDIHCPRCHAFDWKNMDGEEGWYIWVCQKCGWLARLVWSEA
jgi:hypothetical protein